MIQQSHGWVFICRMQKHLIQKDICTPYVHGNSQNLETTYGSNDRWMDKEGVINTNTNTYTQDYYTALKEKWWNPAICNHIDGPLGYSAKQVKHKKTNTIRFHSYVEYKHKNENKTKTNS